MQVDRQMLSTWRPEHGISQGCAACHFDGSVFLHDADMDVRSRGGHSFPAALVTDLVYAADTLVVAGEQDRAELHINCIARAGSNYAFTFSWKGWSRCVFDAQLPFSNQASVNC